MIFCTKRLFEKLILVDYGSFGSSVGFNSVQIFFGINLSLLTFSVLQVLLGTVAHTVWLEGTGLREVRWLHCWVATSRHLGSWHCTWRHLATGLLTATCRHTSFRMGSSSSLPTACSSATSMFFFSPLKLLSESAFRHLPQARP